MLLNFFINIITKNFQKMDKLEEKSSTGSELVNGTNDLNDSSLDENVFTLKKIFKKNLKLLN